MNSDLKLILCIADRDLRMQRISTRLARPSQWSVNIDIDEEQERQLFAHLPSGILVVDTRCPLAECLSAAQE